MKITKRQLKELIKESCGCGTMPEEAPHRAQGRDLDYGGGEGKMTRSQLYKIAQYALELHEIIDDRDDLPEWVQSKIAVAASDMTKVKHYLEYKLMRMELDKH